MKQYRIQAGGVHINVVDWREGAGQLSLLCLHGITANARGFDGIAEGLAPEVGVVAVDLRGRGASDAPEGPYGVETHVRDVVAVLDALGLASVAVAGWSLGSLIGMHLAATYPQRVTRLALLDPPLAVLTEQARESLGRVQGRLPNTYPDMAAALEAFRSGGALAGKWDAAIEAYVRADLRELPDGRVEHRMSPAVLAKEWGSRIPPLTSVIPNISCPVLILRATDTLFQPHDEVLTARAAEKAVGVFQNAQWVDIPGTNHYTITLGRRAETIAALRGFLVADNAEQE